MKNLKDYILHLDNWIPKNILTQTINELDIKNEWKKHQWTNSVSYNTRSLYGDKELEICLIDNLSNKKQLIIFPSIFLYPHLVKPVKKGTRYSFVSWVF